MCYRFSYAALVLSTLLCIVLESPLLAQATQPAEAAALPATQPAQIAADAQALLDEMRDAYARLDSLELAGTFAMDLDAAGHKQSNQAEFTGSFLAPNRFRHEMKDDALVVCTGSKAYLYVAPAGCYAQADAPAERSDSAGLPAPIEPVLKQQNPSLYLAMCRDAARELTDSAKSVNLGANAKIGDLDCHVLEIERENEDMRLWIDPATKLIRRVQVDLRRTLRAQEVPAVNRALVTIDYSKTSVNPALADAAFAWSPPAGAVEAKAGDTSAVAGADPEALKGREAPDFTLKDLEDKPVSLAALRGSVVVLDFWATWCGPCRASLPHLDKLHQDFTDQPVKVFAVNLKESKQVASKYVEQNHLTMPVLLDLAGSVAEKYAVSGIPQTVIIGKNGVVQRVFVGFTPGAEQQMREAVQQALAAQ